MSDQVLGNQEKILVNQTKIESNQGKLDKVLANQEKILANQQRSSPSSRVPVGAGLDRPGALNVPATGQPTPWPDRG